MYDISVFVGRFQPFHKGHLHNILKALSLSKKVIINVGSAFSISSPKNPFSFEQRKQMIENDLSILDLDLSLVEIEPLVDYCQEQKWEEALQLNVSKHAISSNTIAIVGHSKDASSYYLKSFSEWKYMAVDNFKNYSATCFRKLYYQGNILTHYMCHDNSMFGTYKILHDFMLTDQYDILKEESKLVFEYQ